MMVLQCVTELYNKLFSINLDTLVVFFSIDVLLSGCHVFFFYCKW